jgi:Ni,Fe-hydrogenase maturation factor
MRVELENIGIIRKASIELNGLTILTGINDVGKSFVGKSIYTLIKSIKNSDILFLNSITLYVTEKIREIYLRTRSVASRMNLEFMYRPNHLNSIFLPYIDRILLVKDAPKVHKELQKKLDKEIDKFINLVENNYTENKNFPDLFQNDIGIIKTDIIEKLSNDLKSLSEYIFSKDILVNKYEQSFNLLANNVFRNGLLNLHSDNGSIKIFDGTLNLITVVVNDNNKCSFNFKDTTLQFKDVILIESPLFITLTKFILNSSAYRIWNTLDDNPYHVSIPNHIFDIINKVKNKNELIVNENSQKLNEFIKKTIKGEMVYNRDTDDLNFLTPDSKTINIDNIASGIKSFSLIKLLIENGHLNKDTLLIIDEPEVHLHPGWVIEYARLIILLIKNEISVLLSTHSYYMIQALRSFMENEELSKKLTIYWGESINNNSIFENVTENMEIVFNKLVESYHKISE